MSPGKKDLLRERVDGLYRLPPIGSSRSATNWRRRWKQEDAEGAAQVRGLSRPSVAAWAVNQVFWNYREEWDRLGDALQRLGAVQAGAGSKKNRVEELQAAGAERREALEAAVQRAEWVLVRSGTQPGRAIVRRIEMTLEAIVGGDPGNDAGDDAAVTPGRLVTDLQPSGFDVFGRPGGFTLPPPAPKRAATGKTSAVKQPTTKPGTPTLTIVPDPEVPPRKTAAELRKERRKKTRRAIEEAELELRAAEREIELAEKELEQAGSRAEGARHEVATYATRLKEAKRRAKGTDAALRDAEGNLKGRRILGRARAKRKRLGRA